MRGKRFFIGLRAALAIFTVPLLVTSSWAATDYKEKVLHSFNGTDGLSPYGGLIFDKNGNLYGTTNQGGDLACYAPYGCGTVFELTPTAGGGWTEKVLHNFNNNGNDGYLPQAGLIFDAAGNLYGTTFQGGTYDYGTAFQLSPTAGGGWSEKVLHSFNGGDGYQPQTGLIFDAAGNLYGTTVYGGDYGAGTVFELTPAAGGGWAEKVLYSFCSQTTCTDGGGPYAGLILDNNGNLYGTTVGGGTYRYGTVFELTPTAGGGWTETVLLSFNSTDGWEPVGGLILDAAGNLYGTALKGGTYGGGTVFELTPVAGGGWTETVLLSFNSTDGWGPAAGLIFDAAGNLYGTTAAGGTYNWGTVFGLTPTAGGGWTETVLHSFNRWDGHQYGDGYQPQAGLIFDAAGNLFGTTAAGGAYNWGSVFEVSPVYSCARCGPR